MQNININADQALWATNMLPEGIVERWFVAEGAIAHAGHSVAEVRIEGALHDIVSPVSGRLAIRAPAKNVIEPGSLLATVAVDTTPTSMK
jgi:pyruvate/2-oxoglutarate dehydrogenase complex dihydrolipoamide acyltransferase (E2) component